VFASSDVQAIGAWAAITESGRRVPDDIALVGYDDIKTSRYIGLTSVDQSMQEIGEKATELLLSRLSGANKVPAKTTIVKPILRVRRSSGISIR
jgi:LacI family transcriptional regulator